MALRDELLAEVGPKTHIADLCGRAADELLIKQMKIDQLEREVVKLRIMAYKPFDSHMPECDCIQCVPF